MTRTRSGGRFAAAVITAAIAVMAVVCGTAQAGEPRPTGPVPDRPYFDEADWLWNPVPQGAELDPASDAMVEHLAQGDHIANTGDFGVTLRGADDITPDTPRYPVSFAQEGSWGPDPFAGETIPVPEGTPIAPGSDGHLAIADPISNMVYNLWMAQDGGDAWSAGWGAMTPLDGDGREENGSSTGAGLARYAAVVRAEEIAAGEIPHALFFSTNMAAPDEVRYPATKTDGSNMDGVDTPIPEGARVQLDPELDIDSLDLTEGERTVARALQTYGAYVGDNGGARMAFLFEYAPDSTVYEDAGIEGDFAPLDGIPWDRLQVLADWNGGQEPGTDVLTGPSEDGPSPAVGPTGAPSTGAPSTGAPSTGAPSTGAPSTGAPSTGAPSTGAPSTGAPSTGTPSTRRPAADDPVVDDPATGPVSVPPAASTRAPSSVRPLSSTSPSSTPAATAPATTTPATTTPSGGTPGATTPDDGSGPAATEPAGPTDTGAVPLRDIGEPDSAGTGRTLTVGDGGDHSTIQDAVDAARPGDTVEIAAGTYEGFSVGTRGTAGQWITIRAADDAEVVVEGGGGDQALVDINGAAYLRMIGLTVRGSDSHGVYGAQTDHVVLRDCRVTGSSDGGIVVLDSTDLLVQGCEVDGNNARGTSASNEAISIVNTDGFEIVDNHVHDNGEEGIDAKYEARNGVIHLNRAESNRGPNIYIDSAHDIEVIDNVVIGATEASKSGIGLAVENYSETRRLADVLIRGNRIEDNAGAGVDFWIEGSGTISGVTVEGNRFSGNGRGAITFNAGSFSGDNLIVGNLFSGGDEPPDDVQGFDLTDNELTEALTDAVGR